MHIPPSLSFLPSPSPVCLAMPMPPSHPTAVAVQHPQVNNFHQIVPPPMYASDEEPRNRMEGRARRRASPGTRPKPAVRPAPAARVPVVYYLCRNRQLEHPHFMEVALASPQGIYLRDVISRLDALRGKGMAARYSWSCKRSYKNGFVWHDLSKDDLLLPAQGNEYVLKGSELLLDQSPQTPDHQHSTGANNAKVQCPKLTQQDQSPRSRGSSPLPPCVVSVIKEAPQPQPQPQPQAVLLSSPSASTIGDEEQCRTPHSSSSSPKTMRGSMSSSGASSPSITAYKVRSPVAEQDAGTQTSVKAGRGVRSNDAAASTDNANGSQDAGATRQASPAKRERPEIQTVEEDDPPAGAGECCSIGRDRSGTLESLIREEAGRRRGGSARILEEDEKSVVSKLKPGSLLMRLIACGSMSVKNHPGLGIVHTYKPNLTQTHLEFPSSPALSPIRALRHYDHPPAGSTTPTAATNVRVSETGRSSGGLLGMEEQGKLKRSSSCNQARASQQECSEGDSKLVDVKTAAACEQPRSGTLLSITTGARRNNSGEKEGCSSAPSAQTPSRLSGKNKIRSARVVSFHDEKEVVEIEER